MNELTSIDNFFKDFTSLMTNEIEETFDKSSGISTKEIEKFENDYSVELPYAYKKFLENFGNYGLQILSGQFFTLKDALIAHEVRKLLCKRDKMELPQYSFPISHWQGCNFWYFINSDEPNPKMYFFAEGGSDLEKEPAEIIPYGRLTDWLLNLTEEYLKRMQEVNEVNTEKEFSRVQELKSKYQ